MHRTPLQEEDESPSLEVFRTQLKKSTKQPALGDPALMRRVGLANLQGAFPSQLFWDYVKVKVTSNVRREAFYIIHTILR